MRLIPHLPARTWIAIAVPFALLLIGTLGYMIIEGWSWFDSLYMTVITLATVGFLEVHEMTTAGRTFTMFLCLGGIFVLFYTATETIRWIVSGEFQEAYGRERMERLLSELQDHIIVCGFGRMGRLVCHEFERQETDFVVVDLNEERLKEVRNHLSRGVPLQGDATSDEVLRHAGIERAKALVIVLPSDADNLYITLSAHQLNPQLYIVARAEEEAAEAKLRKVGANHIVAPYVIGGHRIAQAVLRPTVSGFLEKASRPGADYLQIEEVRVEAGSQLAGVSLRKSNLHDELGVIVLAIQMRDGELLSTPQGDALLTPGCVVLAVGHRKQLKELQQRARHRPEEGANA